jgi:hypothetical protein
MAAEADEAARLAGQPARPLGIFPCASALELVVPDNGIARLLADVTSMLTWTHYAPIAAGRVAESVRILLTGGHSAADWATMRDQLNIDRAYLHC